MANLGRLAVGLLGILAYQNREKLGELIRGAGKGSDPNKPQGGFLDNVAERMSGSPLGEILDRFRNAGSGSKVDSWVRQGPNDPLEANEVQAAIDDETLASLSQQTGLSRKELIARITHGLPQAVDKMTPNGELPVETREPGLLDDAPPYRPNKLASRP